jgi:hypothetical protein
MVPGGPAAGGDTAQREIAGPLPSIGTIPHPNDGDSGAAALAPHRELKPDRLALVTVVGKPADSPAPATRAVTPDQGLAPARECGPCSICCRLPDIPELNKPIDTMCGHADPSRKAGACTIYGKRPQVCREFECAWKQGLGGDYDRPDILGVMWQTVTMPDGQPGLGVVEAKAGALESPRVRKQLRQFEKRKPGRIVVRRAHEPTFSAVGVLIEGKPLRENTGRRTA